MDLIHGRPITAQLPTTRNSSPPSRSVTEDAFSFFTTFKGLLVDLIYSIEERDNSRGFFSSKKAKEAFQVIEAELNFFFDVLHTKAAIVLCPTGYVFRAISIGSIVSACAGFYVVNKHGFHEYDIRITYTLLLGAIGLEFVALVRIICSDWTKAKNATSQSIFFKFILKFQSKSSPPARWSESIFQYNFIDSRLKGKWPKWIGKPLGLIPLEEWIDDLKPRRVEKFNETLRELIFEELKRKSSGASRGEELKRAVASRGEWTLGNTKTGQKCDKLLPFVRDVDYGESLLLWHIATELCYNTDETTNHHRKNSKVLSDYMLHLMIKQPNMMSAVTGIGQIRFRDTCADTDRFFSKIKPDGKMDACQKLLSVPTDVKPSDVKGDRSKSVLFDACILAKELGKFEDNKWEIVSEVWVELLGHAAIKCQPFMHAQQLSKGGELATLVWLLRIQLGLSEHFQIKTGNFRVWRSDR